MKPLLALLLFSSFAIPHSSFSAPPNIILINIDDLGYADIGPFGSKNATPHLDRMAKEGMKLTSHYAAPVCSPSRSSMMTSGSPATLTACRLTWTTMPSARTQRRSQRHSSCCPSHTAR